MALKTGSVKWFNPEKGFGFIIPDGNGEDVFLHSRIVRSSGLKPEDITEGLKVDYEPGVGKKGVQAVKIALQG